MGDDRITCYVNVRVAYIVSCGCVVHCVLWCGLVMLMWLAREMAARLQVKKREKKKNRVYNEKRKREKDESQAVPHSQSKRVITFINVTSRVVEKAN